MIRQSAFENTGFKMLKGGLHCHTTRSDGEGKPDDVIALHTKNGYDFLAITDHRIYNFKNYAGDGLTIIPGMEFDNTFCWNKGFRTFHTVCLGHTDTPYKQDEQFESGCQPDQEKFQYHLDEFHKNHNLTFYCHPEWSSTPARYFDKMEGNFAMEVWNSGCAIDGMDTNAAYWDELLGQGKHIFGVATDDGHAMDQHCHGWVMVNSENKIDSILDALERGDFYSTTGPVIHDFYVDDDNNAVIKCDGVKYIHFLSDMHPARLFTAENGDGLCEASLNLKDWAGEYRYIRVAIFKEDGTRAWTNPIWLE